MSDDTKRPQFEAIRLSSGCYKVVRNIPACECSACDTPPRTQTILYTYVVLPFEEQRQLAETIAEKLNE